MLTLAYVGTEGHRLITQNDANPGSAALCNQLNAQGAIDVTAGGSLGCGPGNENDVFQLPAATAAGIDCSNDTVKTAQPGCVYSTRQTILTPNFCPGGAQVCYGSNNTNTLTVANSIYNSAQVTLERKANDFTFLVAYTFAKGLDDASSFNDLVNFADPAISRGLSSSDIRHNFVASYVYAVPFDRLFANAPKRLTQGWQIQGITRFSTGFPIQLNQDTGDASLSRQLVNGHAESGRHGLDLNPRKCEPELPDHGQHGMLLHPARSERRGSMRCDHRSIRSTPQPRHLWNSQPPFHPWPRL